MAVTSNINGAVTVDGVYVGNFHENAALAYMSEAELLEQAPWQGRGRVLPVATNPFGIDAGPFGIEPSIDGGWTGSEEIHPIHRGPDPEIVGAGGQDSGGGFAHDPWIPHDPDPDWHPEPHGDIGSPEYGQPGFYDINDWYAQAEAARPDYYNQTLHPGLDFINTVTQPIIDTFPDWEERSTSMGMDYAGPQPSMCKLALMNKALIAIVQAGAVTSAGNPLLGVVGSILSNGLRRLGVGADWGQRIFGSSQDADTCQRIVEEAIAVGYLRIPKPNADGSLPANMRITLDPDSPRATLQWGRKTAARRAPVRRAAPRRRTYRRRT